MEVAVFGGGCFWCLEAAFLQLRGVCVVTSGYAGGSLDNPSYEAVCSGESGHAEVIRVEFDPDTISYCNLLEVFFALHDPTTLNRQGNDVGSQYRSAIFAMDSLQMQEAQAMVEAIAAHFLTPLVTQLQYLTQFFPAEAYHRDYYARNSSQPYCTYVVAPKVAKVREKFESLI